MQSSGICINKWMYTEHMQYFIVPSAFLFHVCNIIPLFKNKKSRLFLLDSTLFTMFSSSISFEFEKNFSRSCIHGKSHILQDNYPENKKKADVSTCLYVSEYCYAMKKIQHATYRQATQLNKN